MNPAATRAAQRNLAAALDAGRAAAEQAVSTVGQQMVGQIHASLSHPGESEPGEPPGLLTGALRRSYRATSHKGRRGAYVAVFSDHPAAAYLEFGTSEVRPRPAARVAAATARATLPGQVARAWAAGVRSQTGR